MKKILIIEDDINIHNLIRELLTKNNYQTIDAYSGTEAILILEKQEVDLILLDLMLPGLKGEEIISKIKEIPIIVLSAKINPKDKVNCLLNGAYDYITKPFNNDELLARIEVQLRINKQENKELIYKDIKLEKDNRTLLYKDIKINLTKTEYAILKQLILSKNQVISKNHLLELISKDTLDCDENSLKVHISNIKKKLRKYTDEEYIESIWGIGYKLSE